MLLRRFTQHVKDQNWFAVGLDFLIVVSGIYIGLQVDAWRVSQDERVMEGQYLERLLADMEVSIAEQIKEFDDEAKAIESMDLFAAKIADGTLSEEDHLLVSAAMDSIGWVTRPVTNLVTVRELQSTGNIALIQSLEIREALGQLELSFGDALYSAEQSSGILGAGYEPFMKSVFLAPSDKGVWGYETIPDYEYILSIPGLAKQVSMFSGWFRYHHTELMEHHEDTIALRDLVKKALESSR